MQVKNTELWQEQIQAHFQQLFAAEPFWLTNFQKLTRGHRVLEHDAILALDSTYLQNHNH